MKKRAHLSAIALLLAAAMLTGSLAGCSESEVNNETAADTGSTVVSGDTQEESTTVTETAADEDTLESVVAALPEANYDGYTFTSYCRNWINSTLFMRQAPEEELTGEPINDALWTRDRAIEDKYNVSLGYVIFDPSMDLYSDTAKVIQAGDDSIGLVYGDMNGESPSFLANGLTMDLNTVPNIDLTQPYWSQHNKDIELAGKLMFATGDITCRYAGAPYLMLFNKQLVKNYGYEYPYDSVREGTWTFDKFSAMVDGTYQDLDGNGQVTNADFFGFIFEIAKGYAFYNSFGYKSIIMNENNEAVVALADENHINAIEKITAFAANENNYITTYVYEEIDMFKQNQAIFADQTACNLSLLTDMENDFGILPLPKENEAQEDYYSFCNNGCATGVVIPKSTQNLERSGMLTNAIAAASRVSSMKEQYEVTLQYRQTRDEDSVEMLQLASEAACYDLTVIFNWSGLFGTINNCIETNSPLTSKIVSIQKVIPKVAAQTVKVLLGEE